MSTETKIIERLLELLDFKDRDRAEVQIKQEPFKIPIIEDENMKPGEFKVMATDEWLKQYGDYMGNLVYPAYRGTRPSQFKTPVVYPAFDPNRHVETSSGIKPENITLDTRF